MTFDSRLAVVALSTFALAGTVGSAVALAWTPRRRTGAPAVYAQALFRRRMLPVALATAAMIQSTLSFMVFEPRSTQEAVGLLLTVFAVLGLGLYGLALARWARVTLATNRVLRVWMRTATPLTLSGAPVPAFAIDVAFPVVAVVGFLRPRLVVARQVIAECSEAELAAIIAHERRHLKNRDNLRRAIMACLPDLLTVTRAGDRLAARWHDAVERAADDAAGEACPSGRCDLASALLKVARLVPDGQTLVHLPASALYRGEDLEGRVRRLLADRAPAPLPRLIWLERVAILTVLIVGSGMALGGMQALIEAAVTYLP